LQPAEKTAFESWSLRREHWEVLQIPGKNSLRLDFRNSLSNSAFPEKTASPLNAQFHRSMPYFDHWIHFVACRAIGMLF
jgi:hypothetical protein